jgi:hypothetical protein
MATKKTQVEEKPRIKWAKSANVFETYANQTHLNWTLDDVRLHFAQIMEIGENLGPGADVSFANMEKAVITVSWRNAKILRNHLEKIISNYEEANGEINIQLKLASNQGT